MRKASELVNFCKSKLGTAYVYGMKGAVMTKDKYKQLQATYGTAYVWKSDSKKIGKVCCDCSGLISWFTGVQRNSTNFKSTATKILPITDIDKAVPGCALWLPGHIGVYIGNGWYIAEDGSAYNCRQARINERGWTHILWLKDVDYSEYNAKKTSSSSTQSAAGYYKKYTGKSVSLVDALKAVGVDSSYKNRTAIAKANGINSYRGTAAQNEKLLALLKTGKLKK